MDAQQLRQLKTKAHQLKPVVMIAGKGVTDAVLNEIEMALDHHELIKIKIVAEREQRAVFAEQICATTQAELIQKIGQMIVIYRKKMR